MRVILSALVWALCAAGAYAQPAWLVSGRVISAPRGWTEFCRTHPTECGQKSKGVEKLTVTSKLKSDLYDTNQWVNNKIAPLSDHEHWGVLEKWSYPDDGKGDCEDYVLLKRRMLIKRGYPRSALLITVVKDPVQFAGHAVLMVRTAQGDLILDNAHDGIALWHETPYRFLKRQSQENDTVWVELLPDASAEVVAHR